MCLIGIVKSSVSELYVHLSLKTFQSHVVVLYNGEPSSYICVHRAIYASIVTPYISSCVVALSIISENIIQNLSIYNGKQGIETLKSNSKS